MQPMSPRSANVEEMAKPAMRDPGTFLGKACGMRLCMHAIVLDESLLCAGNRAAGLKGKDLEAGRKKKISIGLIQSGAETYVTAPSDLVEYRFAKSTAKSFKVPFV